MFKYWERLESANKMPLQTPGELWFQIQYCEISIVARGLARGHLYLLGWIVTHCFHIMLYACDLDKPLRGRPFTHYCRDKRGHMFVGLVATCLCCKRFVKCSKQDKGLNVNSTCEWEKPTMNCGWAGFPIDWQKGNPICSKGKTAQQPDTA